jgi:hypothetical protein
MTEQNPSSNEPRKRIQPSGWHTTPRLRGKPAKLRDRLCLAIVLLHVFLQPAQDLIDLGRAAELRHHPNLRGL